MRVLTPRRARDEYSAEAVEGAALALERVKLVLGGVCRVFFKVSPAFSLLRGYPACAKRECAAPNKLSISLRRLSAGPRVPRGGVIRFSRVSIVNKFLSRRCTYLQSPLDCQ
jgi:hypothetical protein